MCIRMNSVSVVVLVLAAMSAVVLGQHVVYNRPRWPSPCHSAATPCRIKIERETVLGEQFSSPESHVCSCTPRGSCPSDWNQTDHVVSKSLMSSDFRIDMHLMFCNPVRSTRVCRRGETAVVMSSPLLIPTDLERNNCMCEDGVPLQLHRRLISDYVYKHEYVCGNHKPTCSIPALPCMRITAQETRYHCKCPGRSLCRASGQWNPITQTPLLGFCRVP